MPEWQPIETAPKDGTEILIYNGFYRHDFAVAWWTGTFWNMLAHDEDVDDGISEFGNPSHWMPLPEPPK